MNHTEKLRLAWEVIREVSLMVTCQYFTEDPEFEYFYKFYHHACMMLEKFQ